jgi:hypothetical protein
LFCIILYVYQSSFVYCDYEHLHWDPKTDSTFL